MITRIASDGAGGQLLVFWCPGCDQAHAPRVAGTSPWAWNGDRDKPTLSPSILVRGTVPITDDEYHRIRAGEKVEPKPLICHSFVREGRIEFLSDCTHALAGQTVPIPDWPE